MWSSAVVPIDFKAKNGEMYSGDEEEGSCLGAEEIIVKPVCLSAGGMGSICDDAALVRVSGTLVVKGVRELGGETRVAEVHVERGGVGNALGLKEEEEEVGGDSSPVVLSKRCVE